MTELLPIIRDKSLADIEEWFMSGMVREPIPIHEMTDTISYLANIGENKLAVSCADLLQDCLSTEEHVENLISILSLRCRIENDSSNLKNLCRNSLKKALPERRGLILMKNSGFETDTSALECVRRLDVLRKLAPGVLCLDKTWGAGEVKRVDDFYEKVTIDFDKKKDHQMSFAYAAETLEIISEDHVLALRRMKPEILKEIAGNDPARLVLMILNNLGPTRVEDLKDIVEDGIIPSSDWKRFWDSARKSLRANPLVVIPAKRSDSIRLLESIADKNLEKLDALVMERDPDSILRLIGDIVQAAGKTGLAADCLAEVSRRLAYVVHASDPSRLDLVAKAVVMAQKLDLAEIEDAHQTGVLKTNTILRSLLETGRFTQTVRLMPARDARDLLKILMKCDTEKVSDVLLGCQADLNVGVLGESVEALVSMGKGDLCADSMRQAFGSRKAGMALLYWACRNIRRFVEWSLASPASLLEQVIDALSVKTSGEDLKVQNQLSSLLEQKSWLEEVLGMLNSEQRSAVLIKVRDAQAMNTGYARSLMARMIKIYPNLVSVAAYNDTHDEPQEKHIRFTSWRSYNERRTQLRILVEKEIPENSREIAVARSYGDLRENAEYKAAKEHQGILHRRRGEIECDLKEVKGTDFEKCPHDVAGAGTMVTIDRPNGKSETYCILGEWDRDEKLGIISNQSRLAKILNGHRPGDNLQLPAIDGEENCVLKEIRPITEDIRAWIMGAEKA
ncbi:MAG: GreA/GreB family elongation factor [Lentisphaerae bacterium]|nr:GreA/GreB family elongation factor [Lentisphaerota bacterium]